MFDLLAQAAGQVGDIAGPVEQATGQGVFVWPVIPFPALVGAAAGAVLAMITIIVSRYFDLTGGLLTLSVMVVMAFIIVTFVSMIYAVPQTPTTEILIGALSTSVGAIVAFWMSSHRGRDQ